MQLNKIKYILISVFIIIGYSFLYNTFPENRNRALLESIFGRNKKVELSYNLLDFSNGQWNARVNYNISGVSNGYLRLDGKIIASNINISGSTSTGYVLRPGKKYSLVFTEGRIWSRTFKYMQFTAPLAPINYVAPSKYYLLEDRNIREPGGNILFDKIAQKFYQNNPDNYDFLLILTTVPKNIVNPNLNLNLRVKNDIHGISSNIFDNTKDYGSGGRLKSVIWMGSLDEFSEDVGMASLQNPYASGNYSYYTLFHEISHSWLVYVGCAKGDACALPVQNPNTIFHWDPLVSATSERTISSANQWIDNKDGTFTNPGRCTTNYIPPPHPIDLYLMGFAYPQEISEQYFVITTNDSYSLQCGSPTTVRGKKFSFSVQDIINNYGPRIPDRAHTQTDFKMATIVIYSQQYSITQTQAVRLSSFLNNVPEMWHFWTKGKSSIVIQ